METSPLLARRVIPAKERLQKSLVVLFLTAAAAVGVWYFAGAAADIHAKYVFLIAAIAGKKSRNTATSAA